MHSTTDLIVGSVFVVLGEAFFITALVGRWSEWEYEARKNSRIAWLALDLLKIPRTRVSCTRFLRAGYIFGLAMTTLCGVLMVLEFLK